MRVSRQEKELLVALALWLHPVWESDNEDDREEAGDAVAAFLRETRRGPGGST